MNAAKHAKRGLGLSGYGNPSFDKMADDLAFHLQAVQKRGNR